jgi:hypothetical protein
MTMGDVWTLETPQEDIASIDLNIIADDAFKGDREAQNYLRKLWDGKNWDSIKEKLEAEGSVWYVWYMDGVRQHLENISREVRV